MSLSVKKNEFKPLLILLILIMASSIPGAFLGMNWSDIAQIFYFGNKILNGYFPYRDFLYQTGFIPIFTDAFFQKVINHIYISSLLVGLSVKIFTLIIFYLTLNQFTSKFVSVTLCIGLSLITPDLIQGGNEYWVNLFLILSGFFIVIGFKTLGTKLSSFYILLAGFFLALVVGARQSNGIICIFVVLVAICSHSFRNLKTYLKSLLVPWFVGLLLGLLLMISFLWLNQAILEAFYELFVTASEKKNFSAWSGILDALSGGAIFGSSIKNSILKIILYNLVPALIILGSLTWKKLCSTFFKPIDDRANIFFIPILVILGLVFQEITRVVIGENNTIGEIISNILIYDLPRVFFSVTFLISCLFPKKTETFLGLSAPMLSILIALTLGTTWAMQMSWLGRSYIRIRMLIYLVLLVTIMSAKISNTLKKRLSVIFLLVATSIFSSQFFTHSLGQEGIYLGFYKDARYEILHPITKYIKVNKEKATAFSLLSQNIKPGNSCFIYGSAPILYTLLDCKNPTKLDVAYSDAVTLANSRQAVVSLKNNPPQWIIETGQLPYLDAKKRENSFAFYDFFQQAGAKELRTGLQNLIRKYRLVATVKSQFSEREKLETRDLDKVIRYRLYSLSNASN
jgi:hypothetical protein